MEPPDLAAAVLGRSIQAAKRDTLCLKRRGDQVENRCELAENQNPVSAIDRLAEDFHKRFDFGGGTLRLGSEQPEVATRLAEPQQGGQDAHAGSSALVFQGINLRAGGDLKLRVGGFLFGGEFHLDGLFDFRRKFRKDFGLGPPKHPRADTPEQAGPCRALRSREERLFVAFLEILFCAEVAGTKEFEQRPQVAQGIFQRGSREYEFRPGTERTSGSRVLAARIFDVLRLVENHAAEFEWTVGFEIAPQQRVARDGEAVLRDFAKSLRAIGTVELENLQSRDETRRLAAPIPNERRGADDQMRTGQRLEHRERLDGFAESHFIGEEAESV